MAHCEAESSSTAEALSHAFPAADSVATAAALLHGDAFRSASSSVRATSATSSATYATSAIATSSMAQAFSTTSSITSAAPSTDADARAHRHLRDLRIHPHHRTALR